MMMNYELVEECRMTVMPNRTYWMVAIWRQKAWRWRPKRKSCQELLKNWELIYFTLF